MYKEYFKDICEHKLNVAKECIKMTKDFNIKKDKKTKFMLYIHAITHDLSKFSPKEFIPYAKYFNGEYGVKLEKIWSYEAIHNGHSCLSNSYLRCKKEFNKAWKHHCLKNKHHSEYWIGKTMPYKYILQMICDLKAMGKKHGNTAQDYYLKNYYKFNITRDTRFCLEVNLDLIKTYNAPICEGNAEFWMTIEELIKYMENYLKRNGEIKLGKVENNLNTLLKPACDKYKINIYKLIKQNNNK